MQNANTARFIFRAVFFYFLRLFLRLFLRFLSFLGSGMSTPTAM